jgi:putative transposase
VDGWAAGPAKLPPVLHHGTTVLARGFAYQVAIIDWHSRKVLSWRISNSMDGRGRALDNIFVERLRRIVKYEDVYLKCYANLAELMVGLAQYFAFYNAQRPHQSLSYQTPDQVYRDGIGGGAMIVDRFGDDSETSQEKSMTGQRRAAEEVEMEMEMEMGTA